MPGCRLRLPSPLSPVGRSLGMLSLSLTIDSVRGPDPMRTCSATSIDCLLTMNQPLTLSLEAW
jgi:hypothetical protein